MVLTSRGMPSQRGGQRRSAWPTVACAAVAYASVSVALGGAFSASPPASRFAAQRATYEGRRSFAGGAWQREQRQGDGVARQLSLAGVLPVALTDGVGRAWMATGGALGAFICKAWAATGLGPIILLKWAWLSTYWPFTWVAWILNSIAGAPKFYKIYLCYSFGSSIAKWLFPSIHAQVATGTWLGVLQAFNQGMFANQVTMRLRELLVKQAKLQGKDVPLPQATLDAAIERAKGDEALINVMGSAPGLAIWHKLEKLPLDSPALLEGLAPSSQARWMVETLRGSYLDDVKQASKRGTLDGAALKAALSLQVLSQAVDAAALAARSGYASGSKALEAVEKASKEATEAIEAVSVARLEWPGVGIDSSGWDAKLKELETTYAEKPLVLAELKRLQAPASPPSGAAKEAEVV
mmetsp:Transcript_59753/g.175299  ORF Transcript_59753/g.175299 Transcript_59753/m.175299 type:complete len:410 (-) Transcript_59753:31-1260(-)